MEVVDNFLPKKTFDILYDRMMNGHKFEWFYTDGQMIETQQDKFMFGHLLFSENGSNSYHFDDGLVHPLLDKLGAYRVFRIKCNLTVKTLTHEGSGFHCDFPDIMTAIYYVNTNNGYTEFEVTGDKIDSVANRMLIFNSNLSHQGVTATDEKRRVVINFNYNQE